MTVATTETLAVKGGPRSIEKEDDSLFHWPIVTQEDEQAVLEVLRRHHVRLGHHHEI